MMEYCWQALLARRGVGPAHWRLSGRASPLGLRPAATTSTAVSKVSCHKFHPARYNEGFQIIVNAH